jgi:hypothetical protein
LKGRAVEPILLGCPLLLQLWCHERFAIAVVPLYAYEPLPEGHDPRDRFTMGSVVVPSEGNFLPFTFNLSFHFV